MFFKWLVTTNNSSVTCRVQFCSWMLGTNFKLKMTTAAWRFIPYSRHTHIWLRMLSPKDFLPFTDGVCRRKSSQLKGLRCSHEAKNISRAGDNVRRSAFIKRRRLGRGISLFQSLVLYVQSRCCNRDVCRIALNPLSLSIFFAVESYHSDGEGGLNIGHSYDYKNNCHSCWKFITKLQEIHTDLQKIQNYGNQSKDLNGNKN